MRLYGGRIFKNKENIQTAQRREMRNAVVMSVTPASNYCFVKIQGSDVNIKAYYPENWEATPFWLKPGNSVMIATPGGNRGKVEVVGNGTLLPTAVTGGTVTPTPTTPEDSVMAGCELSSDGSGMFAAVSTGTYRIGGTIFVLGPMTMDIPTILLGRQDLILGTSAGSVSFDAAHATDFRIDLVSVDISGDLTVTKGTNYSTDPVAPSTPVSEVLLGWALIAPGITVITNGLLSADWSDTAPTFLTLTDTTPLATPFTMPWNTETMTFTAGLVDQYGNPSSGTFFLTVEFVATGFGNGTLTSGAQSITSGSMEITFYGEVDFTYTRITTPSVPSVNASSPTFQFTESSNNVVNMKLITLEDSAGTIMF